MSIPKKNSLFSFCKKSLIFILTVSFMLSVFASMAQSQTTFTTYQVYPATESTYVSDALPTTNFESQSSDIVSGGAGNIVYALYKFGGLSNNSFCGNNSFTIKKAFIMAKIWSGSSPTDDRIEVFPIKADWTATTVTWNTRPTENTTVLNNTRVATPDYGASPTQWVYFDVTSYMIEVKNTNNSTFYGFRFWYDTSSEQIFFTTANTYLYIFYETLSVVTPSPAPTHATNTHFYWNGTHYVQFSETEETTNDVISYLALLILFCVCCGIGTWGAGAWGFFAGFNIAMIIGYMYTLVPIWAIVLIAILDAVLLFGKIQAGRNMD